MSKNSRISGFPATVEVASAHCRRTSAFLLILMAFREAADVVDDLQELGKAELELEVETEEETAKRTAPDLDLDDKDAPDDAERSTLPKRVIFCIQMRKKCFFFK